MLRSVGTTDPNSAGMPAACGVSAQPAQTCPLNSKKPAECPQDEDECGLIIVRSIVGNFDGVRLAIEGTNMLKLRPKEFG